MIVKLIKYFEGTRLRTAIGFISVSILVLLVFFLFKPPQPDIESIQKRSALSLHIAPNPPVEVIPLPDHLTAEKSDLKLNCRMYNCFDVYKCGVATSKIQVYLYPLKKYVDGHENELSSPISQEFYDLYTAILDSDYYTDNPMSACIFIPPVDFLSQPNVKDRKAARHILSSLEFWTHGLGENGYNHLLFNMLPGSSPKYSTVLNVSHDHAIVAGGGFSYWTYRPNYDISIPIYSKIAEEMDPPNKSTSFIRYWLVVSAQTNIHSEFRTQLEDISAKSGLHDLLVLEKCRNVPENVPIQLTRCHNDKQYSYPKILQDATFCLIIRSSRLGQAALSEAMQSGCIPVFVSDSYVLPFSEVLDWRRASVTIREEELPNVINVLGKISQTQIKLMRSRVLFMYEKYFKSMKAITLTTLQIINDRVFPNKAWSYSDWNEPIESGSVQSPLYLPIIAQEEQGFTVVILAYDRIDSTYEVVRLVDQVPSVRKILVVWNNQQETFPPESQWPITKNPLKLIQAPSNKLSNRFFPYDDIETEAIFAIDDDIVMLTIDEIEFGYQVWREFPDRLVGFPPRLHIWNQTTGEVRYESEWKNDISIVLTGAAFYHKYFNHLYTYKMPTGVRDWVDANMNCEDIAMNFLITNSTGKAPIKVSPRKKFKCPTCSNGLSVAKEHMVERSICIKTFMEAYGTLPLRIVNFRADPVLFKDEFPDRLKSFPNMGSL